MTEPDAAISVLDEREAKLPRWAQDELRRLRANLDYAHEKARQGEEGDTDTWVGDYADGDVGLPRGSRVVFRLPYDGREGRPATVEVRVDGDKLDVRSIGGGLLVLPQVSNVVRVAVERRQP